MKFIKLVSFIGEKFHYLLFTFSQYFIIIEKRKHPFIIIP